MPIPEALVTKALCSTHKCPASFLCPMQQGCHSQECEQEGEGGCVLPLVIEVEDLYITILIEL